MPGRDDVPGQAGKAGKPGMIEGPEVPGNPGNPGNPENPENPENPAFPVPLDPEIAQWVTTLDEDAREFFEERAGIREFDGGLSRSEAEAAARQDVREWQRRRR
jgi:hypothetical protein